VRWNLLQIVQGRNRSVVARSIVFCFLILLAPAPALASDTSKKPAGTIDRQKLITAWPKAYARLSNSDRLILLSSAFTGETGVTFVARKGRSYE